MASTIEVDKLKHSGESSHAFTLPTADGTTGQALVTDGSKTLSFDTVGGANTGWNLIQTDTNTQTISSLVIEEATSGAWSGFHQLKVVITNLRIAASNNTRVKMSNDGGTNYGSWEQTSSIVYNNSGFKGEASSWGTAYAYIFDSTFYANNSADQKAMFEMDIFMDGGDICMSGRADGNDSGGDHCFVMCKGTGLELTAINHMYFENISWTNGIFRLYGLTVS
tara:strand:- start:543 stop:1211 length:669 start_codon:yes stop_codon:yes gene_type:complete